MNKRSANPKLKDAHFVGNLSFREALGYPHRRRCKRYTQTEAYAAFGAVRRMLSGVQF